MKGIERLLRPMLVLMGMVGIYLFLLWGGGILPGSNWTTVRDALLNFWGWLTVLAVGVSVAVEVI